MMIEQIGHECRQPLIVAFRPAIFDRQVLAFDVSGFFQALAERGGIWREIATSRAMEESDCRHRRLLRQHSERPVRSHPAEKRDELAPPHSITSSAVASSDGGTVRPSPLAVLRLMTRSYLVGACTGRSAGFSPLRMRST